MKTPDGVMAALNDDRSPSPRAAKRTMLSGLELLVAVCFWFYSYADGVTSDLC